MNIQDFGSVKKIYQASFKAIPKQAVPKINPAANIPESLITGDTVDLNAKKDAEEIAKLNEELEKQREEQSRLEAEMENLKADFEAAKKEAEAVKEAFDVLIKCIKISGNIISGNKVPGSDHKFLMDNDPDLYMLSISARIPNKDPKELDKVVEKEKKENSQEIHADEITEVSPSQNSSSPLPSAEIYTSETPTE